MLSQWWNTQRMGPNEAPKNFQANIIGFGS